MAASSNHIESATAVSGPVGFPDESRGQREWQPEKVQFPSHFWPAFLSVVVVVVFCFIVLCLRLPMDIPI